MRKMKILRFHAVVRPAAVMAMVTLVCGFGSAWVRAQDLKRELYQALQYRHIGPQGNRVVAVAGIPGDPNTIYAGAATGGVSRPAMEGCIGFRSLMDSRSSR